ncbi:hypothetical protein PseBG33_3268 [Pseudomonas synxantha BG33R]|nr:hypothetical protein PseBG33_3268 [Pseudomonas synxantha BG33R]
MNRPPIALIASAALFTFCWCWLLVSTCAWGIVVAADATFVCQRHRAVGDIWIVTVVSVTSLLLLEPMVVWSLFHEAPGRGALVGFCLGALGMLATIVL